MLPTETGFTLHTHTDTHTLEDDNKVQKEQHVSFFLFWESLLKINECVT